MHYNICASYMGELANSVMGVLTARAAYHLHESFDDEHLRYASEDLREVLRGTTPPRSLTDFPKQSAAREHACIWRDLLWHVEKTNNANIRV